MQTQQNLFLLSFGKSFAPLGIMQYICATGNLHHGRMAQWSAAQQHSADALKFKSLSTQIILDQMGLDGIGLDGHINANRIAIKDWSREDLKSRKD